MHLIFFLRFLFSLDRSTIYKKRKIDLDASLEFEQGSSSTCEEQPSSEPSIINLCPNEHLGKNRPIPPITIYAGSNIFIELKEYRKNLYLGLYKEEDKVIKNRFNFPLSQMDKVEEAFRIIKEHVIKNNA